VRRSLYIGLRLTKFNPSLQVEIEVLVGL
jgi:hypothetical protein